MTKNSHVSHDQLVADIKSGTIDTVLAVFGDHAGRMVGKRTDGGFYLDVVHDDGTENCDYLIACDLDNNPIPGFRWASYDQGYGDMRGVVDESTVRYLPWIDRTAMVLVDLVDVDTGAPVEVSPRRMLQRQVEHAAAEGYVPMIGSEIEFFLFKEAYDEANELGYRDLTPNSPYVEDYHILQTTKEEDVLGAIRRGLAAAGMPVEFSKGEAGRGQHELNLTYQTAVEMADINLVFKNAVKEIAHQCGKSATFMAKPFFADAGSSCHIHSSLWSTDGEALMPEAHGDHDDHGHDPHHMSQLFRWYLGGLMATSPRVQPAVRPHGEQLQAVPARFVGADRRGLGRRQPHARVPRGRPRQGHAGREPHPRRRRQHVPRVRGHHRRRAVRHRAPDRAARARTRATATRRPTSSASRGRTPRRSISGATARSPSSASASDVHHHVLVHAEAEWLAFNQTVTDWERQRYFERI